MKASRRQVLAGSAVLGLAAGLPRAARAASGVAPAMRLVIDPTLPAATAARQLAMTLDLEAGERGHDLASALYGAQRHWLGGDAPLLGVTGHAGYVVASGMARERRLPPAQGWVLEATGPRALPGSGPLPADLAAVARVLPADGRAILWIAPAA